MGLSANRSFWAIVFGSLVHAGVFGVSCALYAGFVNGKFCGQFPDLFADPLFGFGVARLRENVRNPTRD